MRLLRPHWSCSSVARRRLGRRSDDSVAGPPDRRLAHDGRGRRAAALRPGRPALAGDRHGPVPDAEHRRPLERLAARRSGGRGSARPRHPRDAGPSRLAHRQSVLGWSLRSPRLAHPRRRAPAAGLVRLEPGGALDASRRLDGGLAEDPLPGCVACERRDPPRRAALRRPGLLRGRPPHGGLEQLHGGAVAGDRPGMSYHVKGKGEDFSSKDAGVGGGTAERGVGGRREGSTGPTGPGEGRRFPAGRA